MEDAFFLGGHWDCNKADGWSEYLWGGEVSQEEKVWRDAG